MFDIYALARSRPPPLNWTISEILSAFDWNCQHRWRDHIWDHQSELWWIWSASEKLNSTFDDEEKPLGAVATSSVRRGILKILRWIWGCFALSWFARRRVPDVYFSSNVYCNRDCKHAGQTAQGARERTTGGSTVTVRSFEKLATCQTPTRFLAPSWV